MKQYQQDLGSDSQRWNRQQSQQMNDQSLQESYQQKENYQQMQGFQAPKSTSLVQNMTPSGPSQPSFSQSSQQQQQQFMQPPLSYRVSTDQSKSPMRDTNMLQRNQSGNNNQLTEGYFLTGWGNSKSGQLSAAKLTNNAIQAFGNKVASASAGEEHTIIIDRKQELYACGSNQYGQLGIEGVNYLTKPTLILALKDIKISQVCCGANHTFALTTQGEVYAWGLNIKGQLGIGNFENQLTPVLVYSLLPMGQSNKKAKKRVQQDDSDSGLQKGTKSTGEDPSFGLQERSNSIENILEQLNKIRQATEKSNQVRKSSSTVSTANSYNFGVSEQTTSIQLGNDEVVTLIACGSLHTIVLTTKNRMFSCGYGGTYALGHGDQLSLCEFKWIRNFGNKSNFDGTQKSDKIEKISCGLSHSACIIGGKAYIWGISGESEQLKISSPTEVNFFQGENSQITSQVISDVQASDCFTLFLNIKGEVIGIGDNIEGQLCSEKPQTFEYPIRISSVPLSNQIAVGRNYCLAISKDMKYIYGWGSNAFGQVTGRLTNNQILISPMKVQNINPEMKDIKLVCGSYHTIMLSNIPLSGNEFCMKSDEQQQTPNEQNEIKVDSAIAEIEKIKEQSLEDSEKYLKQIEEKQKEIEALKKCNMNLIKNQEKNNKEIKEFKGKEQDLLRQLKDAKIKGDQIATTITQAGSGIVGLNLPNDNQKFQIKGVEKFKNINFRVFNSNLDIDFNELILEAKISEGGYGIIHRAKWRETIVAVKKFKMVHDEATVRDFLSECHAMEALRHPNIVMFLGACTKAPNFSIILEFCQKGSLWSLLQSDIKLTWEDRRRIALDTAKGVHYLHSSNPPILHRDLKSLNLLLDDNYRCKLADFGWTRVISQDNYMTTKIGTFQWMAPEVINSNYYSEKADVFSYGIILWEIASREPPYKNKTGANVSIEVVQNNLRPIIPKTCPPSFSDLMQRCWDNDPLIRPSFKEIIKELEKMTFKLP